MEWRGVCSGVEWSGAGCDDSGNGTAMHKINLFPSAALCLGLKGGRVGAKIPPMFTNILSERELGCIWLRGREQPLFVIEIYGGESRSQAKAHWAHGEGRLERSQGREGINRQQAGRSGEVWAYRYKGGEGR